MPEQEIPKSSTRVINMTLSTEFVDMTANCQKARDDAIGYLVAWAVTNPRYSGPMTLYGSKDGNLYATYRDLYSVVTYSLFGQLSETGQYSFHS